MKLSDFLSDVGRPVAYHPRLKKLTGSTNATILLCQFIYWKGKEKDPDGWLYKTSEEIEEETGLSYNEQKTARKKLVSADLMEEHYARLDHQMRFRINPDVIDEKWRKAITDIPESDDSTMGNDESSKSLNRSTETTTDTLQNSQKKPDSEQSEEKKPDILDGIFAYQKKEVINVDHYPVDVQEIVDFVGTKWGFQVPGKGKKDKTQKAYWITKAREIKNEFGSLGYLVLEKGWEAWEAHKIQNGEEPYSNVKDIGSIVSWFQSIARKMRQGDEIVREDNDPTRMLDV